VTAANLRRVLNKELAMGVPEEDIINMIEAADLDKDGIVNEKDFVRLMKKKKK